MEPVRNLNNLLRGSKVGLYKRWIWQNSKYFLACDYLQKMNYSIQDINRTISEGNLDYKSLVFLIVCVDWVRSSYKSIKDSVLANLKANFLFSDLDNLLVHEKYFSAMRSFVVAHPLETNKHSDYGLDGNFICVDLRRRNTMDLLFIKEDDVYHIDIDGLIKGGAINEDLFLYAYSQKENKSQWFRFIGFSIEDILDTARLYVNATYELDSFLAHQKKTKMGGEL